MRWAQEPFLSMTINTLPGVDGTLAQGSWFWPIRRWRRCPTPGTRAWETVPGSQNTYNQQVATGRVGVRMRHRPPAAANLQTCCIPTVSALDLDQEDPSAPIGQARWARSMPTRAAPTACSTSSSRPR